MYVAEIDCFYPNIARLSTDECLEIEWKCTRQENCREQSKEIEILHKLGTYPMYLSTYKSMLLLAV